jgi:two-component system phosphate regulon sensor histidine kinase PhoR
MDWIKNRYVLLIILHGMLLGLGLLLLNANWTKTLQTKAFETSFLNQSIQSSESLSLILNNANEQEDWLPWLRTQESIYPYQIEIYQSEGEILSSNPLKASELSEPEQAALQAAFSGEENLLIVEPSGFAQMYLQAYAPIHGADQSVQGILRFSQPLSGMQQSVELTIQQLKAMWVHLIVIMALINILLYYLTLLPIRKLTQHLTAQLSVMFYQPYVSNYRDGMGKLIRALNKLLSQFNQQTNILKNETIKRNSILKHMSDGMIIVNDKDVVEELNLEAQRIFEMEENEAIGLTLIEVARHHTLIALYQSCKRSRKQESLTFETIPNKLFLNAVASPLQPPLEGYTLLVIQDLTRLRHLEMIRKDFVSNVSHELRTPIASIKALTETLSEGAIDDPLNARRFLGMMENEIDNINQMVQELLELSRIEAGKAILDRTGIRPIELIDKAVERMQIQAERAGLQINCDCSDQLPKVFADPGKIGQVLINLIHNAIKFSTSGGSLKLKAEQSGSRMKFSVSDEGIGIEPQNLNRIFERFYKEDQARSGQGTGLGLAIAKHIVESHGGRIWAENQPTHGAIFYFTLPIQ